MATNPTKASASAKTAAADLVTVRVLRMGHRKVFTGETNHEANEEPVGLDGPADQDKEGVEVRFPTHPKGAVFRLPAKVAADLEKRGFVEIQDEPAPAPAP